MTSNYNKAMIYTYDLIRSVIKKFYWGFVRYSYNPIRYVKKGRHVDFGSRFRFSREYPYKAYVGEKTNTDECNIWNAKQGDIVVGHGCWFGLYNILMGPVEIGNNFSSGPFVSILGPRHPYKKNLEFSNDKTVIGNNVTIATGSIILFGVRIGDNVVVSAGSVVNKDIPANAFVAGNPARDITRMAAAAWKQE